MVGIPKCGALWAHGMGKLDLGAIANVGFDLLPTPVFGTDFFAGSADGQDLLRCPVSSFAIASCNSAMTRSFSASVWMRSVMSRPLMTTPRMLGWSSIL